MSTDTERAGEETRFSGLQSWRQWYHLPVIAVVMLFMVWVRLRPMDNFEYRDGRPTLAGVDSYYHWRTVEWTAENYPWTMPYDVFTGFPTGRYVGQFGTLFDQFIVTIAMIVGLGSPSGETLFTVSLVVVPVLAALVAIPVFYMGRRLGGTFAGLISIAILALAPGSFLGRSTAGQLQHHVAEVLLMATAVLAMMVALRVAERDRPIWELVADRNVEALREPLIYSALAGVALTLYIWVWPPGVVLVGILGAFFAVHLCLDYIRGISPDHVAFVGAVSLGLTAILTTLLIEEPGTSVTSFGYLQPVTAFLVAVGCVFMAWFARQWDDFDVDRRYYPGAILGLMVAGLAGMALLLPDLYSTLIGNLTGRLLPISPDTGTLTISEAQPPGNFAEHVREEFGMAFYTMLAGLAFLVARPFFGREFRAEHTLIVVWSLFLISMAATQVRFAYYLLLAVAVVNAVFVADLVRLFDLDISADTQSIRQVETYQVIVVFMVVLLLFAPLLPPFVAGGAAWEQTPEAGPHFDSQKWDDSLVWLGENTPEPGAYGGYDNADDLDYFGSYDYPDGANHAYPEGAYGVMSWWDYGHLITTQSERIPHSNPFQQNARSSSAFFTAESEARSELILDAIAEDASVDWSDVSDEELEAAIGDGDSHEEMRYVMIDDAMAGTKFPAITEWSGPDQSHYTTPDGYEPGDSINASELSAGDFPYADTTLSQLYFDDANGMENYRLVHENDFYQMPFVSFALVDQQTGDVLTEDFNDVIERQVDPDADTGESEWEPQIFLNQPQQVLAQFQVLEQAGIEVVPFDQRQAAAVKTFERVEGATITGSVDDDEVGDDAVAVASLDLETDTDRAFTYTQVVDVEDNGSFEIPVSYATNDELGVEDGYTDSSVEANGTYTVRVIDSNLSQYEGSADVPETAVVNGEPVESGALEVVEDEEEVDIDEDGDESNGAENGDADDENGDESDGDEAGAEVNDQ